jgi:hypothetical protein
MLRLLSLAFLTTSLGSIKDCSNGLSILKPTKLEISPPNAVGGEVLNMIVELNNPGAEINDGIVTTSMAYNFIPLDPTVEPLCINTQCPLVTGFNNRSTSNVWPKDIAGTIKTKIQWTDISGNDLLCLDLVIKSSKNLRGNYSRPDALEISNVFRGKVNGFCPVEDPFFKQLVVYQGV